MNKSLNLFKEFRFICSFLFLSTLTTYATDIHVAKNGTDVLTGRGSSSKPYKTISYLFKNNLVSSNDVIIVHSGVYRETVTIDIDNITIRPYENDKVTITGSDWYGSTNWKSDPDRPGVFKLSLNSSLVKTDFTQLFVNGQHQQIARFPDNISPYKNYVSGSNREMMNPLDQKTGFAVLLNANKPAGANAQSKVTFSWHGGTPKLPNVTFSNEAIVRGFIGKLRNNIFSYSQDGGQVTRAGDRLVTFKSFQTQGNSWGSADAYSAPEGFGYIMDLSVLDKEGEWFYKRKANTLYYKPKNGTMSGKNFEVRLRTHTLKVNADNVNIQDIDFKAGEVEIKNASNTKLTRCTFTYMTPYHYRKTYGVFKQGIILDKATGTNFESCYIGHTWGSGIVIEPNSNNTKINNSIIEDIGWMGQFTVSLLNNGNNTHITKNTFGRASRFHIRTTESVYTKIIDNDFYNAMCMGEDAGSIMFTSTGKAAQLDMKGTLIAYNKIHDLSGIPAYDTKPLYKRQKVVGLYLEDVDNYTVHHNLVYNIKGDTYTSKRLQSNGKPVVTESKGDIMYLGPRNRNLTRKMHYYNNTFWNYDYLLTFWQHDGGGVKAMEVKNNLMVQGKSIISAGSNSVEEDNFYTFTQEAAKAPLNYSIVGAQNKSVTNANTHYIDASNGNFRLNANSSFNTGGIIIPGITSEANPAIGAWEGDANWKKNRVFNAGAKITSSTFINNAAKEIATVEDIKETISTTNVYPNPFSSSINIAFSNTNTITPLVIRNMSGAVVLQQLVNTKDVIEINTASLPRGTYFIELIENGKPIIKKVFK